MGDPAIAIGNAPALDATSPSVSSGIVSAPDRVIHTGQGALRKLIQAPPATRATRAGPPLDGSGRVIGINTAVAGGAQNVGFAIAADIASLFVARFEQGFGERLLGLIVVDLTPPIATRLDLDVAQGALVVDVAPGSPADRAGIEQYSVITGYAGRPIESADDLTAAVFETAPGETVEVTMVSDGEERTVPVTVEERSDRP